MELICCARKYLTLNSKCGSMVLYMIQTSIISIIVSYTKFGGKYEKNKSYLHHWPCQ